MKKGLIVIVVIVVLASGGYAFSKVISKSKIDKNTSVVQLENGQEIKISNKERKSEFNREEERPDVIGKIKSIDGGSIIIEKFDMSNMGGGRGEGKTSDGQEFSERPEPTISGEVTVALAEDTSYVKGAERGMGSRGGGNKSGEIEEISKNDLEEGNMISAWILDGGETAERIMVR